MSKIWPPTIPKVEKDFEVITFIGTQTINMKANILVMDRKAKDTIREGTDSKSMQRPPMKTEESQQQNVPKDEICIARLRERERTERIKTDRRVETAKDLSLNDPSRSMIKAGEIHGIEDHQ